MFITFLISLFIFSSQTQVFASSESSEEVSCVLDGEYGEIVKGRVVVINNEEQPLFCEFANNEAALGVLKREIPALLSAISEFGSIRQDINSTNWRLYQSVLLGAGEEVFLEPYADEVRKFAGFFDIYENVEDNEKILTFVTRRNGILTESEIEEVVGILPNNSPISVRFNNSRIEDSSSARISPLRMLNLGGALNYATSFVYNPNYSGFGYINGADCTNFVSQILYTGGVSQNSVWWHNNTFWGHRYSVAWINTPAFAAHMGVMSTLYTHLNFSQTINIGDVAVVDLRNDYQWDHAGFVTAIDSSATQHWNGYYRNYRIAQHSDNAHRWGTDVNSGWDDGLRWGVIRK